MNTSHKVVTAYFPARRRRTFTITAKAFGPLMTPEYKAMVEKHKASQERIARRKPQK